MEGVEPVDEVPIGLYTKLRKTKTSEMDVMQILHVGKLSNLAHIISTYGCLYQYHLISATWATTNKTILFHTGCVNMQKYDHMIIYQCRHLSLQIMTSPFLVTYTCGYTTTGGTLPVDVIVSKLKPDMVFYNKKDNTIHLVELTVPFEKKKTSRKLMIVRLRNIETLFLIFWIMDSPVIWLVLKLDHVASVPLKISGTLTKSSLLLIPSHLSHSGRNSANWAKWPFWPATPSGTLDRSRPGALKINRCSAPDFPSSWRCPMLLLGSFLNFFASHLLLLFYMFLCVYSPASKGVGSLLVLGLNVLPFVMHFVLVVCNVWIKVDITQIDPQIR